MRKFSFRLQRALRFALLRENQKKTQVAGAIQRISFLKKYSETLDKKIQKALEVSSKELNTLAAEAHRQAVMPAIEEHKRIGALLEEEYEALHVKQRELVSLSQRRRSLESLKEKQARLFKTEESRREQKSVDSIVQSRSRPEGDLDS